MRKLLSIFLIFFYLIPAVGFSVDAHWCGKKLRIVAIDSVHEKKCPCSKKMSTGCCNDVHVSVKLTDSQKASAQVIAPTQNLVKNLDVAIVLAILFTNSNVKVFDFSKYHAPPFKFKQPVYLSINVFRI